MSRQRHVATYTPLACATQALECQIVFSTWIKS